MRSAGGAVTVLVGTVVLRLTLTGTYTRYVRPGMGPWLIVTGVVVILLGLTTLLRAANGDQGRGPPTCPRNPDPARGFGGKNARGATHDHGGERVGWLLLAPIAALLLVAPPALGSYGVNRGARLDIRSGASGFEPLPADGGPVPLTLLEFNQRAVDHDGTSFAGATVQLTGFVADDEPNDDGGGDGFRLARYQIACCAADAAPVVVDVVGAQGNPPTRDQWVTATGTFRPTGGDVPELVATNVTEVPEPDDPYE